MKFLYDRGGEPRAVLEAHMLYGMTGHPAGFVDGTHVFTMTGHYVGELHRDMVVDLGMTDPGRTTPPLNPGPIPPPDHPGSRGAFDYGAPDRIEQLLGPVRKQLDQDVE